MYNGRCLRTGLCATNIEMRMRHVFKFKFLSILYLVFSFVLQNEVSRPRFEQNLASLQHAAVRKLSVYIMHVFAVATMCVDAEVQVTTTDGARLNEEQVVSRAMQKLKRFPHENLKQLRKLLKPQKMSSTARKSLKKLKMLTRLYEKEIRVLFLEIGSVRSYFCCQTLNSLSRLVEKDNLQQFLECLLTCLFDEEGEEIAVTSVSWEMADFKKCEAYFEQVKGKISSQL